MSANGLSPAALAVDLGGTTLKGAVVGPDGRPLHRESCPTPDGGDDVTQALGDLLIRMRDRAAELGAEVAAAGIVTPGIVDDGGGSVGYASNLGWRDVPLAELMAGRVGVPVAVGHDVRAAGLAERLLGEGRDEPELFYLAIGTGVAAAIFDDDEVLPGATRSAGEIGHIPVFPDGEPCTCGQRGCLEVYLSGAGLARRYAARTRGAERTAEEIAARLGADPAADEVWTEGVRALALGLATVTLTLDPSAIILGGGVARAGAALLEPVRAELDRLLAWRPAPRVAGSALGTEGGRIGAAALAFRRAGLGRLVTDWTPATVIGGAAAARSGFPIPAP